MENKIKTFKWKNLAIAVLGFAVPVTFFATKYHYNSKLETVSKQRDQDLKTAKKYINKYKEAVGWLVDCQKSYGDNLIRQMDESREILALYIKDSLKK